MELYSSRKFPAILETFQKGFEFPSSFRHPCSKFLRDPGDFPKVAGIFFVVLGTFKKIILLSESPRSFWQFPQILSQNCQVVSERLIFIEPLQKYTELARILGTPRISRDFSAILKLHCTSQKSLLVFRAPQI